MAVVEAAPGQKYWFVSPDQIEDVLEHSFTKRVDLIDLGVVIRQETRGSSVSGRPNEDSPFVIPMGKGRELVSVLDGASSRKAIAGLEVRGVSGAYYISHLVSLEFVNSEEYRELCNRETLTAGDVMRTVNRWLFENLNKVEGINYQDILSVPGMAASFCLIDAPNKVMTVAHVADTTAVAIYTDRVEILTFNQNQKFDDETTALLESLAREHELTPRQVLARPDLKALVKAQLVDSFGRKTNVPDGCGILDGMPQLEENNLIYENKVEITPDMLGVIIVSDGALQPYLKKGVSLESAVEALADDSAKYPVGEGGQFLEKGREDLLADPEYLKVIRLKDNDDATLVRVDFLHEEAGLVGEI